MYRKQFRKYATITINVITSDNEIIKNNHIQRERWEKNIIQKTV